ncbi:hypothetical protein IR114_05375 [Granulicatella sp. 19428wC4_WM01]|uniref:hypothetical protein n=1 Tax=Granulicatella sp. WM01 TaxID=2558277 RepID=UPI001431D274|nr:hypothetical protein [Granulicatella sp. WM01]MBF0780515.1 hypothetical protein [Granulicatella sp. 19428wC4_WM01]
MKSYQYLQQKYNWTPKQIDEQLFHRTFEIEHLNYEANKSNNLGNELVFIDQLGF